MRVNKMKSKYFLLKTKGDEMKKRILWLGLSLLVTAALVLASCGPAVPVGEQEEEEEPLLPIVPSEQEEEEEEEVVVPAEEGVPQYGGTVTLWRHLGISGQDPPSPDIAYGYWYPTQWLSPVQEKPFGADFEKYGPRGTNEFAFQLNAWFPMRMLTGVYLEDWSISSDEIVWNVRPGMYYHDNKPWVMEPREITAEDVAADVIYYCNGASGGYARGLIKSPVEDHIYARDRYTVVIETLRYDANLVYLIGFEDRALLSPPELQGSDSWDDQLGSGPFMLDEYVVGSYMHYLRNPNYWGTATIDGVVYDDIPFIDDLYLPIIPDESTAVSALRTGKLDYMQPVKFQFWDSIDKTAPEIQSAKYLSHLVSGIYLHCDRPPFDNENVRRAVQIGTDIIAFQRLSGVTWEMPKHAAPFYTGDPDLYTPLEDLPADIQILYDYNPELAMEMLALEGYPDGFTMDITVSTTDPASMDRVALAKDMYAKIGVDVTISAYDQVTVWDMNDTGTFKEATSTSWETANALNELHRKCETGNVRNFGRYSNTEVDDLIHAAASTWIVADQNRLMKEAGLIVMYAPPIITWNVSVEGFYWWPWLKNYYGEKNVCDHDEIYPLVARMWIDEDLKTEMGY